MFNKSKASYYAIGGIFCVSLGMFSYSVVRQNTALEISILGVNKNMNTSLNDISEIKKKIDDLSKDLASLKKSPEWITKEIRNIMSETLQKNSLQKESMPEHKSQTNSPKQPISMNNKGKQPPLSNAINQNEKMDDNLKNFLVNVGLEAMGLTEYGKFKEIVNNLFSEDMNNRAESIKKIAKIASPEIKSQLFNFIKDENENPMIRHTSVESIEWKNNGQMLADIFQGIKDPEIQLAIISKARSTDFNEGEKGFVEKTFVDSFVTQTSELTKLSILEYFVAQNSEIFNQLLQTNPIESYSPNLREHVKFLQDSITNNKN